MGHHCLGRSGEPDELCRLRVQQLFGYSETEATNLMLQVHHEGKAVVSCGARESMEIDVSKLHAAGLWATLQQDR